MIHWHCGTNNRVPRWSFMDPWKIEMGPGALEESVSPAWLRHNRNVFPPLSKPYTFLAQFWERHEDLFNPEQSIRTKDIWIFWIEQIYLHASRLNGQLIVYYTESWKPRINTVKGMMSEGRHEDLYPAHVTSLNQSHFFICHNNNNGRTLRCWPTLYSHCNSHSTPGLEPTRDNSDD